MLLTHYGNCAMEKICVECTSIFVHSGTETGNREIHANIAHVNGYSILMNTARNGHEGCLNQLLTAGANVNKTTENQRTALMFASSLGHKVCVELLLAAEADVNMIDQQTGNTALIATACGADRRGIRDKEATICVKLLLKAGAKINIKNHESWTALRAHLHQYNLNRHKPPNREMCTVLFAAGDCYYTSYLSFVHSRLKEQKYHIRRGPARVAFYLSTEDLKFTLINICREDIRKHLLDLDPHTHLFCRIPKLGLSKSLTNFLLYNMSL